MKANTSIEITHQTITHPTTGFDGSETRVPDTGPAGPNRNGAKEPARGKPESELRAAARRKGLTLKELAGEMGVSYGYLSRRCPAAAGPGPPCCGNGPWRSWARCPARAWSTARAAWSTVLRALASGSGPGRWA